MTCVAEFVGYYVLFLTTFTLIGTAIAAAFARVLRLR